MLDHGRSGGPVKMRSESRVVSLEQTVCSKNRPPLRTNVLTLQDRRAETWPVRGPNSRLDGILCELRLLRKLTLPYFNLPLSISLSSLALTLLSEALSRMPRKTS
jgi:hypothetical protein